MDQTRDTNGFSPEESPGEQEPSAAGRREFAAQASKMAHDARVAKESAADLAQAVSDAVGSWMNEKPYLGVAIAAGAGYLFGGGLGPRLTSFALRVGGRVITGRLVASLVRGASAGYPPGSLSFQTKNQENAPETMGGPQ